MGFRRPRTIDAGAGSWDPASTAKALSFLLISTVYDEEIVVLAVAHIRRSEKLAG